MTLNCILIRSADYEHWERFGDWEFPSLDMVPENAMAAMRKDENWYYEVVTKEYFTTSHKPFC